MRLAPFPLTDDVITVGLNENFRKVTARPRSQRRKARQEEAVRGSRGMTERRSAPGLYEAPAVPVVGGGGGGRGWVSSA